MVIDERARHALYQRLEQVLGEQEATTLMEHLPPAGWADVATHRDVDRLGVAQHRDLEAVRKDMQTLASSLRKDMQLLESSFRKDMQTLASSLRKDMQTLEQRLLATFRGELGSQMHAQTRTMIFAMTGSLLSIGAIAFTAARLV